jgi:tetratricopeptide (TPR) repeat protein
MHARRIAASGFFILFFLTQLAAQSTQPPYLAQFPSVEQVRRDVRGSDAMETVAKQCGLFWQMTRLIYNLAYSQRRSDRQFTADERRLVDEYNAAHGASYLIYEGKLAGEERRRWFDLHTRYEVDRYFRDEALKRYFSPQLRVAIYAALREPAPTGTAPRGSALEDAGAAPDVSRPAPANAQPVTPSAVPPRTATGSAAQPASGSQNKGSSPELDAEIRAARASRDAAVKSRQAGNETLALQQFSDAVAKFKSIIARYPYSGYPFVEQAYVGLGGIYAVHLKQYDLAVTVWKSLITLQPGDATNWVLLGQAYHGLKDYDATLATMAEALRRSPSTNMAVTAHVFNGYAYRGKKQHDKEVAELKEAARLNPSDATAAHMLGIAYYNVNDLPNAIAAFERAVQLKYSPIVQTYNWLATIYIDRNEFDKGLAAVDAADLADAGYANNSSNRGRALRGLKRDAEAVAAYEKAARLKPDDPEFTYLIGITYYEWGNNPKAIAAFQKAIAMKYGDPHYAYTYIGDAYSNFSRWQEAVAAYREAVRLKPAYAYAHHRLAQALSNALQPTEALAEHEIAVRLEPKNAKYLAGLGTAYASMLKKAEATAIHRRLLALDPDRAKELLEVINRLR